MDLIRRSGRYYTLWCSSSHNKMDYTRINLIVGFPFLWHPSKTFICGNEPTLETHRFTLRKNKTEIDTCHAKRMKWSFILKLRSSWAWASLHTRLKKPILKHSSRTHARRPRPLLHCRVNERLREVTLYSFVENFVLISLSKATYWLK